MMMFSLVILAHIVRKSQSLLWQPFPPVLQHLWFLGSPCFLDSATTLDNYPILSKSKSTALDYVRQLLLTILSYLS